MSGNDEEVISVAHGRLQSVIAAVAYATVEEFDACLDLLEAAPSEDDAFSEIEVTFAIFIRELREAKSDLRQAVLELEAKLETIERQQTAIRQLSTPIIEVRTGVLCLPIIGPIDGQRGSEITEVLLETVVRRKARLVIIDLTGIEVMSADVVGLFLRMGRTVRLLGVKFVLSGINPAVAQALAENSVDVTGLRTVKSLGDALALERDSKHQTG